MANNDNAKLNVNIEGSENIVNSLNAIVASFSNFSKNLTSLANKVTKFNRDAAAIATGLKALKDASSGGKITRDQSRNPVNAILSLDTLKQTFATYKKYLKAEMRESIEMLLSQKSYGGSAKENNALIALIKNSAKAKKEYLRESRNFGAIVEKTESHFATIRKREEREIKKLEEAIKVGLGRIAVLRQKQAMSTNKSITSGGRDPIFDRMESFYKSQDADMKNSMKVAKDLIAWKEKENQKLLKLRSDDLASAMKIGKEMIAWKEKEAESLKKAGQKIDSARVKRAVSSITEKDPELTAMSQYYNNLEKQSKKNAKLRETVDQNSLMARVKVGVENAKAHRLAEEKAFKVEQAQTKEYWLKRVKADNARVSNFQKQEELKFQKEKGVIATLAKKKEAELKRQSALSIRSQIVDRFKKMGAQPGQELDYTITGLSNFKEAASNTIDTVTERMKVFGMVSAGIVAGFVGIGVAIKNWGYEVILTTEKLRGYNIALLGSMKTQKDVNNLLKASEEITKDLPVGYEQMIQATKALSLIAPLKPLLRDSEKSKKVLGDVWNIVLGLSQIEPEWGISGAIFSLREALSGDLLSLKRRFEIPVDFVTTNEGKKISEVKNVPEKMLEGLSNFMSQSFGKEALEMTAKQFGAVLNKIENLYTKFKGAIGESGIYEYVVSDLQKVLDYFNAFSKSGAFNFLAKDTSDSLIAIYENVKRVTIGFAQNLANIFGYASGDISQQFSVITDGLKEFNFYLKWMADYINSPQFQSWLVDFVNSGKKLFYDLSSSIQNAMYEAFQYVGTNAGSMYDSIVWVVNEVRGLVGDKGLLALLILGPTNVISLISASFQTINGLVIVTSTLFNEMITGVGRLVGLFGSGTVGIAGWVAGLTAAFYVTKSHLQILKGSRSFWQYLGIGETEEQKAQTKMSNFVGNLQNYNKMYGKDFTSEDFQKLNVAGGRLSQFQMSTRSTDYSMTALRPLIDEWKSISQQDKELAAKAEELDKQAIDEFTQANSWLEKIQEHVEKTSKSLEKFDVTSSAKSSLNSMLALVGLGGGSTPVDKLKTQAGISLEGVKDSVASAGKDIVGFFKTEIGKELVVSSAVRKGNEKSQHFTGDALDFSVKGIGTFDLAKFSRRDFLEKLGSQAKESGVRVDFENSLEDTIFAIDEMNVHIKEINKSLGGEYLKAWTNPKATGAHLHMASLRGGVPSTAKPSTMAPSPMGFRPDTKDVNYYFSQDNLKKAFAEYRGYLDGFNNSIFAVKKIISDGDELSASMVEDIRKQFQKDGGAKVGFERVEELKAALANLKAEKDSFSQVFGVIGQNVNNLLNELPKFINIPEGIFGTTFKGATGVVSGYIAGGFKDQVGPLFQEILEKKFGEAENLIPGEIEKSIAVYRGQIRAALVTRDNTFVKLIPDVQQEIANKIITEYAETLPLIFDDKEMIGAVQKQLGRVREGLFAGKSFADAIQGSFAQFSVEALTKRMSQAPANDVVATMFAVTKDAEKTQGMMKVADALNEIFNSSKKAAVSLEETNKLYQKQIGSAKTMAELMQFRGKGNRATRSAFYGQYQTLLETEPQGNAFQMGIESSLSNFKNWSEQMFEIGSQLVTDLSGVFETNFFDTLTGKFKSFADMFKSLGNAIRDMIVKIIAKMAAISLTKIVLGFDISGGISGGGGGGFGGILNSVVGGIFGGGGLFGGTGGGSAATGISGMALQAATGSMGMGGFNLGSVLQGGIGATAAKAGGMKLLGSGGALSKAWGSLKAFNAANPWVLPAAAAGMFLTQPGRLFGGTKDKTAGAQEQYAAASQSRDEMVKRRYEDAMKYYGSGNASSISNFGFGNIGYYTWSSGDGWFKGPKEKHAATDTSSFDASMKIYYTMLRDSARSHAQEMYKIDRLRVVDEIAALKQEQQMKQTYISMVQARYNQAQLTNNWADMDEFRDQMIEAELESVKLAKDIVDAQKALAKNIADGLREAATNFASTVSGLKGTNYSSGNFAQLQSFYALQRQIISGSSISGSTLSSFGADPSKLLGLEDASTFPPTSKFGNVVKIPAGTSFKYGEEGKQNILDALDQFVNDYLKGMRISNLQASSRKNIEDMTMNLNNSFISPMADLYRGMKDTQKLMNDLRNIPEATEEYYQLQLEYSDYQTKLSDQIKSWMNSGLIKKDPSYWIAILNGPLDKIQMVFESVAANIRLSNFKGGIFEAIKGLESNTDFTNIVDMIRGAGGDTSLYSGMTSGADPWESWYNWSLTLIQTKIKNAQKGSEEYFTAQEELFKLMAEKADRQKQNAEDAYAKIEESLNKIAEVMQVRVAEESKTSKGDTYFIDVGASRDAAKQLEAMLAKINTNDPKAKELIEAFKKRILGTR